MTCGSGRCWCLSRVRWWTVSRQTAQCVYSRFNSRLQYDSNFYFDFQLLSTTQLVSWATTRVTAVGTDLSSLPSRRHLRSAESGCLAVTGTMTNLGGRNFAVAGAKVWNSLPVDLRVYDSSLGHCVHADILTKTLFVYE